MSSSKKKKHPKIKKKRQNDNNNAMKYDYVLNHNYHKAFLKFTICFHFYCYFCACAFFSSFHCFIRISCLQSNSTVIFRVFSFDFLLSVHFFKAKKNCSNYYFHYFAIVCSRLSSIKHAKSTQLLFIETCWK